MDADCAPHPERWSPRRRFSSGVLDALPEYLMVIDCEGRLLAANATWRRLADEFGLPEGVCMSGRPYLEAHARLFHGGKPGGKEPDAAAADM